MQPQEVRRRVGLSIKSFREAQRWSQSELAERLGAQLGKAVDPTTITRMEKGTRPTSLDELFALSSVFVISPTALIPGAGIVEQLVSDYELESKLRSSELDRLSAETHRAATASTAARTVRDALYQLRKSLQEGDTSRLPGPMVTIASVMDRFGGFTHDIPIVGLLLEAGVSEDILDISGEAHAGYLEFVRRALQEAYPNEWVQFEKEDAGREVPEADDPDGYEA